MVKKDNESKFLKIMDDIKYALYLIAITLIVIAIVVIVNSVKNNRDYAFTNNELSTNELVEASNYDTSNFNVSNDILNIINENGTHVIYFGRSTCEYCKLFIPIAKEVQELYNFKHYYYDVSNIYDYSNNKMIDVELYDSIVKYDNSEFMSEEFLSTPLVAIFKDGKYVNGIVGYQDIETYSKFLEENGFSKKGN